MNDSKAHGVLAAAAVHSGGGVDDDRVGRRAESSRAGRWSGVAQQAEGSTKEGRVRRQPGREHERQSSREGCDRRRRYHDTALRRGKASTESGGTTVCSVFGIRADR